MFDKEWRFVIYCLLLMVLIGCAMGPDKTGTEDIIETAGEAGCHLKSIKFKDGQIEQIECHDTVRYIR
jgi:hypothetical protein